MPRAWSDRHFLSIITGIKPKLQAMVFAEGVRARIRQPKADIAANAKQPSDLDDLERLAALRAHRWQRSRGMLMWNGPER